MLKTIARRQSREHDRQPHLSRMAEPLLVQVGDAYERATEHNLRPGI